MAVAMSVYPDERVGFPANQAQALVLWPLIACTEVLHRDVLGSELPYLGQNGLTMCSEVDPG
jgi:hypothetical protein